MLCSVMAPHQLRPPRGIRAFGAAWGGAAKEQCDKHTALRAAQPGLCWQLSLPEDPGGKALQDIQTDLKPASVCTQGCFSAQTQELHKARSFGMLASVCIVGFFFFFSAPCFGDVQSPGLIHHLAAVLA